MRIRMDPHQIERQDPNPDLNVKVVSWISIRIRINLQMKSQNVFEHIKFLRLYLEARAGAGSASALN